MPGITYRTGPTVPAEIVTYRLGTKLVYVRPADNYEEALDYAQKEFSDELTGVDRSRISFHISAKVHGHAHTVRISESAWDVAVARLLRGEVIDICIKPLVSSNKDAPPKYLEVPGYYTSASFPGSRSPSPSPSTKSEKPKRSWFGKS